LIEIGSNLAGVLSSLALIWSGVQQFQLNQCAKDKKKLMNYFGILDIEDLPLQEKPNAGM